MHVFRRSRVVWLGVLLAAAACSRGREYELRGQVLAVDPQRQELTIKHDDIRGFMPGMTMPFKVSDARGLDGRQPGDLIRATLVVEETSGYLKDITVTGRAPLSGPPPLPRVDLLQPGDTVPDGVLIDESGKTRTLAEWRGHVVAVTFIYTRCPVPDFCPQMDRRFGEVQRMVAGDAGLRDRVHLLSISFDPDHDTPAVIAAHARKVGADPGIWSFLTGDRQSVTPLAARFGVNVMPGEAAPPDIVHNLRTSVIDAKGRLSVVFGGSDWTAQTLVDALRNADARR
jgi:protein SCO1